jgi:hypothetical protein
MRERDKSVRRQRSDRTGSRWVVCGPAHYEGSYATETLPTLALGARCRWREGNHVLACGRVHECTCSHAMVSRYQSDPSRVGRISGPLLDRADFSSDNIHIDVPRVEDEKLSDERLGEPSTAIQARVEAARERQRFEGSRRQA